MSSSESTDFLSMRDRAPTLYPLGPLDPSSGSDSDPSEEYMLIVNDSEDSSIQILTPSPPHIIDLVDSPDEVIEVIEIADSPMSVIDLEAPIPETEQPAQIPDPIETPVAEMTDPVDEGQLSPIRIEAITSLSARVPRVDRRTVASALVELLTSSVPVYVSAPTVPTVPDYMFPPVSDIPVCDTAPPAPAIHVPAPVVITCAPPFPAQSVGGPVPPIVDRAPVPWAVHDHLYQQFRWVWLRYEEVFTTRDAIL